MLSKVVVFFAVVAVAYASIAVMPPAEKPESMSSMQGCYIAALDKVLGYGESAPAEAGQCYKYVCHQKYVGIERCGVMNAIEPCTLVEDKSMPFPTCCPTMQCPSLL